MTETRSTGKKNPNANLVPERIVYTNPYMTNGGPRVVKKHEMHLSDDELLTVWKTAEADAIRKANEQTVKTATLRAKGFSQNQIAKLRPFEEFDKPAYTPKYMAHFREVYFDLTKKHFETVGELAVLQKINARVLELKKMEVENLGWGQLMPMIAASKAEFTKAVKAGKTPPEILTEAKASDILVEGRVVINREIGAVSADAQPIFSEIIERMKAAAEELADTVGGDEIEAHAKHDGVLGWAYVPSQFLVSLRQFSWRYKELVSGDVTTTCKNLAIPFGGKVKSGESTAQKAQAEIAQS